MSVVLYGVTNRSTTGAANVSVATSSDTVAVTKPVTYVAAHAVGGLTVVPSTTAVGSLATWTIGLTASSTGALSHLANGTVTIALPAGASTASFQSGTVTDTTKSQAVSNCSATGTTTITCSLYNYWDYDVSPGDVLSIELDGITNPTAAGSATITVTTSSDTVAATQSVTYTSAQSPTAVSVTTNTAAVGALAAYTVGFTTSASGALAANTGSVTVTFPSGTDTTPLSNFTS